MKRLSIKLGMAIVMLVALFGSARADLITIGTGSATVNHPFRVSYEDASSLMLYKASDFLTSKGGSGEIISIAFNVSEFNVYPMKNFKVFMQNTTMETVTGNVTTGWTEVFSAPSHIILETGWMTIPLNPTFDYNGTNLLIKICHHNPGTPTEPNDFGTSDTYVYASSAPGTVRYRMQDNGNGCEVEPNQGLSTNNRPNIRFSIELGPTIVSVFPLKGANLLTGQIYSTSPNKPGIKVKRRADHAPTQISYEIRGINGLNNLIYQAHEPGIPSDYWVDFPTTFGDPFTHFFSAASGAASSHSPFPNNGNLDLQNNFVPGGDYEITAKLKLLPPGNPNYIQTYKDTFRIAVANDIAVTSISEPRVFTEDKYALGKLPIKFDITNVGANPITEFIAYLTIYKDGNIVWKDSVTKTFPIVNPLKFQESITIQDELRTFTTQATGKYTIDVSVKLLSAIDLNLANNIFPTYGKKHEFEVVFDQEPRAVTIHIPSATNSYFIGRPVRPLARFANSGITDMTHVKTTMTIVNLANPSVVVYQDIAYAQDIPAGVVNNFTDVVYEKAFIPPAEGTFRVCVVVEYPGDPIMTNNEYCQTFTVTGALSGTYTIGTANLNSTRNYVKIKDAVDALFVRGVGGPVVFELTDETYNEGNIENTNAPALDFRSRIVGATAVNNITFRPSNQRSVTREGVRINLASGTGVGMLFGMSHVPTNSNSTVYSVQDYLLKTYSISEGHIIFDGGAQKAFLFTVATTIPFRAVIYLSNAKNITIKNSVIKDGLNQTASNTCELPNNYLNVGLTQFVFESDWESSINRSFSTGVYLRSTPPIDLKYFDNRYNLDTLSTNNNIIQNNEISNFGYGVVSFGIGTLLKSGYLTRYANHDNQILGNKIYNIATAGVFAGFEENTRIEGNRIYNVNGSCGNESAGIMAGALGKDKMWGFYNIGMLIRANEISHISGATDVYGVKIQQVRTEMSDPSGRFVAFPNVVDNNIATNNIIWGLAGSNAATNKYGIRYFTQRNGTFDVPFATKQFTQNDRIVNNTIIMSEDAYSNTGVVAALALQQTKGTFVYNNAIAFLDNSIAPTNDFATAVLYNTYMPNKAKTSFNRNVYYVSNPTVTPIFRFIETTDSSNVLEYGSKDEFLNLQQWQIWTGMDTYSAYGNFMIDMEHVGINPSNLRIRTNPSPKGSVLSNRGDRLPEVNNDIDGRVRGVANQRFDVGAVEFDGLFYNSDLEVMSFVTPGAYKAPTGLFNDAEYFMTYAPVNIKARLRNAGNIQQTDIRVALKIYRERPTEYGVENFVGDLVKTKTVKASISSTDDIELDYLLSDENGVGDDWTPSTYSDLRGTGYTIPAQFMSMQPNVTPRYRIVVALDQTDEVLSNNVISKVVRFYLRRSTLNMVISTESSHIKIDTTIGVSKTPLPTMSNLNNIAGRLNADTLIAGFKRIGWVADYTLEHPRYDIDIFERNGWEARSVNYGMYRSMIWSDGNDNNLTRYQVLDLRKFFDDMIPNDKKNFVVGSQEMVRLNQAQYPDLIKNYIRSTYSTRSGTNLPFNPALNPDQKVVGYAIARDLQTDIVVTGWNNPAIAPPVIDAPPMTVYHDLFQTNQGTARVGMYYKLPTTSTMANKIASVATSTLETNVVLFGIDWRHFGNIDFAIRATLDYIEANGGTIVPVELISFNAEPIANRVELNWSTASEINSSRFDVERADVSARGVGSFAKFDEVQAKGNASVAAEYGPVIDRNVQSGATYAYRLKMVDLSGEFTYSNEKIVTMDADGSLSINEIVPNPAVDQTRLTINIAVESAVTVELFDMSGRLVSTQELGTISAGSNNVTIDTKALASGSYRIVLTSGSTQTTSTLNVVK